MAETAHIVLALRLSGVLQATFKELLHF